MQEQDHRVIGPLYQDPTGFLRILSLSCSLLFFLAAYSVLVSSASVSVLSSSLSPAALLQEDVLVSQDPLAYHSERISGYVMDQDDRPLNRVRVLIEYPGYHRVGSTNNEGYYSISTPHITTDEKVVEFSREGFQCHREEVVIDENTLLNVTLNRIETDQVLHSGDEIPVSILLMGLITLSGFYLLSGDRRYLLAGHLGIPLYSKLDRSGVLGQKTRRELFNYLRANPGVNYTTILKKLNFGTSTIVHHLSILEREGLVRSRKELGRRLFYPKGISLPQYSSASSLPPSPIQRTILEYLSDHGPTATLLLEKELHIKRSTLVYSLSRLKERGLVGSELHGRSAYHHVSAGQMIND